MTKADLVDAVAKSNKKLEVSKKDMNAIIDNIFAEIVKSIKKDKRFVYPDFGTFVVKSLKARKGRNPQTGKEIRIQASKTVRFRPAPHLKKNL